LLLLDEPWILDVLRFRIDCIRKFFIELRRRMDAVRSGIMLSAAFIPPVKIGHDSMQPRPWLAAQSYAAYKEVIDLLHCVVHWGPDEVQYNTRRAIDAVAGGVTKIVTHIRCYGESRPENLSSLVSAVRRGGAPGVGYFCYDLMSREMLDAAAALSER